MQKIIFSLFKNQTVRANLLMVGGNFVANIGAYLYHLAMGRMLPPSAYGELQSLISFSNILNIPLTAVNTIVVKFVSLFVGKNDFGKVAYFYKTLKQYFILIAIVGSIAFLFFSKPIQDFLHLPSRLSVIFIDISLFLGLLYMLNKAIIQGQAGFIQLTINQFIESYGKLILGVLAVWLGWQATGAFGAFVMISIVGFSYTQNFLNHRLPAPSASEVLPKRDLIKFAIPSLLMTISMISLYNTDVVLVRHFMSADESGLYAALSVLGKIIFFGSAPVTNTMFPLVSAAHAKGEKFHKIFLLSLFLVIGIAGFITLFYSLHPVLAIRLLVGVQYVVAAEYLVWFSIFLSLCAVINLLSIFFLSIHKLSPIYLTAVGAIVQAGLIIFRHTDLLVVIINSLLVTAFLSLVLLLYYAYVCRQEIVLRYRSRLLSGKNHRARYS